MTDETSREKLSLVDQVDQLSDEVKSLAIDLAVYLAKARAKGQIEDFNRLEPDFMSLVNGAVKTVRQVNLIIDAARQATGKSIRPLIVSREPGSRDQIEIRLRSILDQCERLQHWLDRTTRSHESHNG